MKKSTKNTLIVVAIIIGFIAVLSGSLVFTSAMSYKADEDALNALETNALVKVTYNDDKDYYLFEPTVPSESAFVFMPGGLVEAKAYAPLMRALAENGITCILLEVKFTLAVFDKNAPADIKEDFPNIQTWSLGGHSLGGAVASMYIEKHTDEYENLVLLGAYPEGDLSKLNITCVTIYGSEDTVMNKSKFEKSKSNYPDAHTIYEIEGGNHAQFGSYGKQRGDGEAKITKQEQIAITVARLLPVLL